MLTTPPEVQMTIAEPAELSAGFWRESWRRFCKRKLAVVALAFVVLLMAIAAAAPLIAVPAAYAMAFFPGKRTKDLLLWMLSTKMMPAVGALVPIYVMAQTAGLLESLTALVIVFTGAPIHAKVGVPLLMAVVAVWMWRRPEA